MSTMCTTQKRNPIPNDKKLLTKFNLSAELQAILNKAPNVVMPESRNQLLAMALGNNDDLDLFQVAYDVPGQGEYIEATVSRCKNGASVNYTDIYMRRRDPDCMVIADENPTDKPVFEKRHGYKFNPLRAETFEWLGTQNLLVMPFMAGDSELGYPALLVAPDNAAFFAAGLSDLQGFVPKAYIPEGFTPRAVIYLAPPFRHTHFGGKQVVVHNRLEGMHELFSYNLYPGPSAKKGIYGVLLNIGEQENWVTVHGSTVRVITPYDNQLTITHEGASGGGKSEMIEQIHREMDGRILLGTNLVTDDKVMLELSETCELQPVTDDMALCHPSIQNESGKLVVKDAENGWFLRIDHITHYGTDPHYEKLTIHPQEPLIFLNIDGAPGSTCLIWEHILDAPGKPCPNPRVIMPRRFVEGTVNEPVEVDIRSFGVRTPPCTKENPTYGIIGIFHVLPASIAWLWRMVAPRGHGNPSITDTVGMTSEGVGSYWPFATGKMVDQANLLLKQILDTPNTRYILTPNQHIGAYKVGFKPQWIAREYLARRGSAKFNMEQISPSRCPLLGFSPETLKVDGTYISRNFLRVHRQPEVGEEGYDAGAAILSGFFKKELKKFMSPELHDMGKEIIDLCMNDAPIEAYLQLTPLK